MATDFREEIDELILDLKEDGEETLQSVLETCHDFLATYVTLLQEAKESPSRKGLLKLLRVLAIDSHTFMDLGPTEEKLRRIIDKYFPTEEKPCE